MSKNVKIIFYTLTAIALVVCLSSIVVLILFQDVMLSVAYVAWSVYLLLLALWVWVDSRIDV